MSFRNFLPSNDITKPEIFAELTRRGAALDLLRDDYGEEVYIAKYSKRDEVFDLIDSIEFQFCDTLRDFDVLIRSAFGRRPTRLA